MKPNETESPDVVASEQACVELLDSVVQEITDGRSTGEIRSELVRQRWDRTAATRFCQLASQIAQELKFQPAQRSECAKRGAESMQAAYGWIGFGVFGGIMLYVVGNNGRSLAPYALLPVLYGVIEFVSGFLLWWPHRDYFVQDSDGTGSPVRKG